MQLVLIRRSALVAVLCILAVGCQDAGLLNRLDGEVPAGSAATGLGAINVADEPTEPGKSFDYSLDNQIRVGTDLAKQALARSKRSRNRSMEAYLTRMVRRLAAADPRAPRFLYRVYLIESPNPNAFTSGGGHIFVTTGLVARLHTEAQMAMVLAHELAHNTQAHVLKGRNGREISQRVVAFGKRVFEQDMGVPWVSHGLTSLARTGFNSYTRAQEEEADRMGLETMIMAGYDPREAPRSFSALLDTNAQKQTIFAIFDGYPAGLKRAEAINAAVYARFRNVDLSAAIRSTPAYDKQAAPFWATVPTPVPN
jgi:predicted Zn-dependent protease